jgi:phosphoglycolate phosphatase-like HAD superfamily hydrolase
MRPGESTERRRLLVLDFDGVICDSIEECFVASWAAFHEHLRHVPSGPAPGPVRTSFRELRPFVRSGEDFVLIQQLIAQGSAPRNQEEFDEEWDRPGAPGRAQCKELFYRARTELRDRDPPAWLAMNRIYPHVPGALARLSPRVPRYVLSTKKPEFVIAPLEAARLPFPRDCILYIEAVPKLAAVERLLRRLPCDEAVFVEDQVDAIRANRDPRIRTFLATWGYVPVEQLRRPGGVALLEPDGLGDLLASL